MTVTMLTGERSGCVAGIGDKSRSTGTVDKVLHGRGRPFGAAAWSTLVQPFELGRDFAKRQVRVRRMDTGDERHQPILGQAGRGPAKQCRIGQPLRDHPFHGAAKTLRRPAEAALVQYAGDVVLGVIWPHAPNGRKVPVANFRV